MPSTPSPSATKTLPVKASVLIVDPSADSREVLRMGLRRRGVEIIEASHAEQGLAMIDQHRPQIVVLDVETDSNLETQDIATGTTTEAYPTFPTAADSTSETTAAETLIFDRLAQQQVSLIVLGKTCPSAGQLTDQEDSAASQFFSKPYQYGAVIRKIEELVRQSSN